MFQYNLIDWFFIQAGPQVGLLFIDEIKTYQKKIDYSSNLKPDYSLNTYDFGFNLGFGFRTKGRLNFDVRYNLGLKDILTGPVPYDNKNRVLQFTLGYDLKKFK